MSESHATGATQTVRVQLTPGALGKHFPRSLIEKIDRFRPLPFSAGLDALKWLRHHVRRPGKFPLLTILDLDPKSGELLGFCVLGYIRFHFDSNPDEPEVGADVSWIARSVDTDSGFGEQLFAYAVKVAEEQDLVAMVVTPHDDKTAHKVWVNRFKFLFPPREDQPAGEPPRLYLPLRAPYASA